MGDVEVEKYINSYPEDIQVLLRQVQTAIRAVVPAETTETINYGIPTFQIKGKNLVHYAAYKNHIGFYPGPPAVAEFQDKLTQYETSKGTIKFPTSKPIPLELIQEITSSRLQ